MSYVGAGRFAAAEELIADRERYVAEPHPGVTNQAMTARVGLPVCKAIVAFGKSRYGQAVDLLYPIRTYVNEFGGATRSATLFSARSSRPRSGPSATSSRARFSTSGSTSSRAARTTG